MSPTRLRAVLTVDPAARELSRREHDQIAQALNEYFLELGHHFPVAYADP